MPSDSPTYAPMLAGTSQDVPAGDAWRFEIKWDGFRAIARVAGRRRAAVVAQRQERSRPSTAAVAAALPAALTHADCVLDGELCAFDENGVPSFEHFQRGEGDVAYVVFDLLEIDGEPVFAEPWSRRRELLEQLIRPGAPSSCSRRSSKTARRCSRRPVRAASRASWPSGWVRPTGPAAAATTGARSRSAGRRRC